MILLTALSCGTAYLSICTVERVQATERDMQLAAGAIPAIQHFHDLAEMSTKLLILSQLRVRQLERYIDDNGLRVPVLPPAKPRIHDSEVI